MMKLSELVTQERIAEEKTVRGVAPFTHGPMVIPDSIDVLRKLMSTGIEYYVTSDHSKPKEEQVPILFFLSDSDLKKAQSTFKSSFH